MARRWQDYEVHNTQIERFEGGLEGRRLHPVKIIRRVIFGSGAIWSGYSFIIPTLAAEGHGFATPEDAVKAAMRVLLWGILMLLAVL